MARKFLIPTRQSGLKRPACATCEPSCLSLSQSSKTATVLIITNFPRIRLNAHKCKKSRITRSYDLVEQSLWVRVPLRASVHKDN